MNNNFLWHELFYRFAESPCDNNVNGYINLLQNYLQFSREDLKSSTFTIEFLGTPEAGKTTCLEKLVDRFIARGISVVKNRESAELLPTSIKKGSLSAHLWMKAHTVTSYVNNLKENPDILLVDRGIVDSLLWDRIFLDRGELSFSQVNTLRCVMKPLLPNLVVSLIASPDCAIERRGGEGHIVTKEFIANFNNSISPSAIELVAPETNYTILNTDGMTISEEVDAIEKLLNALCCLH